MYFGTVGVSENVRMNHSDGWLECEHVTRWTYPGTLGSDSCRCMQFAAFVVSWDGMAGGVSMRLCRQHARQELHDIASGRARDRARKIAREHAEFRRESRQLFGDHVFDAEG